MNLDPASYLLHKSPAIVQPAVVKNCAWWKKEYQQLDSKHDDERGSFLASFKASGAWKDEYSSFSEACREVLGITRQAVDKQILKYEESKAATEVGTKSENTKKTEESDERAMRKVEKDREKPVSKEYESSPCVVDDMGFPVPASLLETHARGEEITKLMSSASALKCFFDSQQKPDKQFNGAFDGQVQTLMTTMGQVHYKLSQCRPDIVCPACDGKANKCHDCRETGFISNADWTRLEKNSASWIKARIAKRKKALES